MKAAKKARRVRRIIKKVISSFFLICVFLLALGGGILYYPEIERYLDRFTVTPIDTAQIDVYYDLLTEHKQPGKKLLVDLGINDTDSLQTVINKLKVVMGMAKVSIGLDYHDEETPPAYILREGEWMTVFISSKIKERNEQISLLIHELSHIYVWRLDSSVFGACNEEKLVDCVGVFLGLGVFALNSLTDEYTLSSEGGGYQIRKRNIGYLTPEQFAYLLARYCAGHNIEDNAVKPYLTAAGRKCFDIGKTYFKEKNHRVVMPAQLIAARSAVEKFVRASRKKVSDIIGKIDIEAEGVKD